MQKVFAEVGTSLQQIGGDCPAGWIEMVSQRPDDKSVAAVNGTWEYPTYRTTIEDREAARAIMNPLRDTFLNRLAGIAMFSDDPAVKQECASVRIALLDITKDPAFISATTYEAMEIALMIAYRNIAIGVSEHIRSIFRELEV